MGEPTEEAEIIEKKLPEYKVHKWNTIKSRYE